MPGFKFTSLHRSTGSHFLDFSPCRCDDSAYDEAYGPKAPSKHCHDEDFWNFEDSFLSKISELPEEADVEEDRDVEENEEFDDVHSVVFAWEEEDESPTTQYGPGRVELGALASYHARKYTCAREPRRNGGRKPRAWWQALAKKRRRETKRVRWWD